MKIALLVTGGLHPSGRAQIIPALLSLVERLAREHDVHAFAVRHLPRPCSYELGGAHVHDLGSPHGLWRQWRAVCRALQTHGPFDVVHGHWAVPAGLLAALAGRRFGIASIVTCDSGEFTSLPQIGYGLQRSIKGRGLVALACRLATRVHVTSEFMERLARARGIDVIRIPLGVELPPPEVPSLRLEGPPWRLLQIASLNPVKDHATLLRAVASVRRTHDVRLDLVGEDTLGGRLQREGAALGVADAVTFHGFVPHDALAPFHRAAHVYVQSSLHEAAGMAVLEAAAAGLPIVGTRAGFVSDWDGDAAVAVPPGNAAAMAQAIVRLLDDPSERQRRAHAARRVAAGFSASRAAQALAALYRQLSK